MNDFQVDEQVIWTSPHTNERISMSYRGKNGDKCCLYNLKSGMQVIAPLSEVDHDWRRMCEVEETSHAQTRTELAYVMQERNEYLERVEALEKECAELRAAALAAPAPRATAGTRRKLMVDMRVSFFFAWYDFWIGAYWDAKKHVLYICPLPCLVFKFQSKN